MAVIRPEDEKFGAKAVEFGFISAQTWEEYRKDWQEGRKWRVDLTFLLLDEGAISLDQSQRIADQLKEEKVIERVGDYKILSLLGKGGMGSVYKAQGAVGVVALKVMDRNFLSSDIHVKRFFREIQAVTALHHPNIVRALDFGADLQENIYFVALEFVDGTNLMSLVTRDGVLSAEKALEYGREVARALQYAFENRIVHRDIKPENIMFSHRGEIKVTDFGLAKNLDGEGITQTGTMLGTPYYMAPELSQGEKNITIQADIYALAITLFYLLVGKPPFYKGNSMQVIMEHMMEPVPSIGAFRADLSPGVVEALDGLIAKMAAKVASERPFPEEVIQQMGDLLEKIRRGDLVGPAPSPAAVASSPSVASLASSVPPALPGQRPSGSPKKPFSATGRMQPIAQSTVSAPVVEEKNSLVWIFVGLGVVAVLILAILWLVSR